MWNLLCAASTQWNTSDMGPTSLKYEVLVKMADTFNVDIDIEFYGKVRAYEKKVLKCFKDKIPKPKKGKLK